MNTTIGIIGGGQLGKMIAQEAKRMSLKVIVLDPTPDCPAVSVSDRQIVADFKDRAAIRELAKSSDVVTYEIESGDTDALAELEREGSKIYPSSETLRILQDKLLQKEHLKKHGLPVPEFVDLAVNVSSPCADDLAELYGKIVSKIGYPFVAKARRDSYDGRGNLTIHNESELPLLVAAVTPNGKGPRKWMAEKFVPFKKEVSVMVARNLNGQIVCFPTVENLHEQHILKKTIAPARVEPEVACRAVEIAQSAIRALDGVGIFGVEMFVTGSGEVLINEIAPRPHNSGHYTIEACNHSQFEMHLRAILNQPLVQPTLNMPAVMVNILGEENADRPYNVEGVHELLAMPGVKLHLYGKKHSRLRRKLGHITAVEQTVDRAIGLAERAWRCVRIVPEDSAKEAVR